MRREVVQVVQKGRKLSPPAKMRLLPAVPDGLSFTADNRRRGGPYINALRALMNGQAAVVEADDPRARASLVANAKKMEIELLFAEHDGKLFVRLARPAGPAAVLSKALAAGPLTMQEIGKALAAAGFVDQLPVDVMRSMSEAGLANLRDVGGAKKWCAAKTEVVK